MYLHSLSFFQRRWLVIVVAIAFRLCHHILFTVRWNNYQSSNTASLLRCQHYFVCVFVSLSCNDAVLMYTIIATVAIETSIRILTAISMTQRNASLSVEWCQRVNAAFLAMCDSNVIFARRELELSLDFLVKTRSFCRAIEFCYWKITIFTRTGHAIQNIFQQRVDRHLLFRFEWTCVRCESHCACAYIYYARISSTPAQILCFPSHTKDVNAK